MTDAPTAATPSLTPSPPWATAADRTLLASAADFAGHLEWRSLSGPVLADVSARHGGDFATALLYDRIRRSAEHGPLIARLEQPLPPPRPDDALLAIVPGAFHRHHAHTGADGRRLFDLAATLRLPAELVPLPSFAPLDHAAAILLDFLRARRHRQVILASLSKGGAEVKHALARPGSADAFAHVRSWVNLSGIVCGTPLVDWIHRRPLRRLGVRALLRLRGQRYSTLRSLAHGPGTPLHGWPTLPPHLRALHIVGFPLTRHLSHPWARRAYDRLLPLGPNDGGGILLGDVTTYPGQVLPLWAADHYLRPSWDATPLLTNALSWAASAAE
jgi:hypothetical protein